MFGFNQNEMLQKMQQAVEESKTKLASTIVYGDSGSGLVKIELNGNRELISLSINTPLNHIEKEDLEDLLSVALKRALEEANRINEQEMSSSALQFLPKF
jgi:DNA-binding YbaB/EbfC family protein